MWQSQTIYSEHEMDATGQNTPAWRGCTSSSVDVYKVINSRYDMPHPHVTLDPGTTCSTIAPLSSTWTTLSSASLVPATTRRCENTQKGELL
jgi:hypothetical protein